MQRDRTRTRRRERLKAFLSPAGCGLFYVGLRGTVHGQPVHRERYLALPPLPPGPAEGRRRRLQRELDRGLVGRLAPCGAA